MAFRHSCNAKLFASILILLISQPCVIALMLSRAGFLSSAVTQWFIPRGTAENTMRLPLRFLPVGGCWALRITVIEGSKDFTYYGIVDTGSPFLTCPTAVMDVTEPTRYPVTLEQYGEATGGMTWRKAPFITLYGNEGILERRNVVLGMASENVIEGTGGIFVGLIERDENRPTFLKQLGYRCFKVKFDEINPFIDLSSHRIIEEDDPESCKLFDLTPYGPDVYHYGIQCDVLELVWNNGKTGSRKQTIQTSELRRPVVAVLDTGLTGCIFSDSLFKELCKQQEGSCRTLKGATVTLPKLNGKNNIRLENENKFWQFSSFRLPWFYNEEQHPHIIALGSTFWVNCDALAIDTTTRLAKIILKPKSH